MKMIMNSKAESFKLIRTSESYSTIQVIGLSFSLNSIAFKNVTADFEDYIKNTIILAVENYWEAALKVIPVSGNLTGQKQTMMCNNSVTVPSVYSTTGVPADLVLFVDTTYAPTQDYVAYAGPCIMSQKNSRYIVLGFYLLTYY